MKGYTPILACPKSAHENQYSGDNTDRELPFCLPELFEVLVVRSNILQLALNEELASWSGHFGSFRGRW
jgi:hypothetical protein